MKKLNKSIFVEPTSKVIFDCIRTMLFCFLVTIEIWIVISWINVGINNCSPETVSNILSWNFFVVFF